MLSEHDLIQTFDAIQAAYQGDVNKLRQLKEKGAKLDLGDYDLRTPLHLAASEGHLETVKYLVLEEKVDTNPVDRFGGTPVSDSLRFKHWEVTRFLIENGGRAPRSSGSDSSELFSSIKNKDIEKLKILIESGVDVNSTDYDSRTALHIAARENEESIAEILLQAGSQVNVADRWGSTPLLDAIKNKNGKLVELFKSYGAVQVSVQKIMNSPELHASLQEALNHLCESRNWSYGAAWIQNADKTEYHPTDVWYSDSNHVSKHSLYHSKTRPTTIGAGMIGKTAAKKEFMWFANVQELEQILLRRDALEAGFKSGLAFPVLFNNEVLAVLQFFANEDRMENPDTISETQLISTKSIVNQALATITNVPTKARSEQSNVVHRLLMSNGTFAESVVSQEVDWFYESLGLPSNYFILHSPHLIAKHLFALISAKLYAQSAQSDSINYKNEENDYGMYLTSERDCADVERRIEGRYLGEGYIGVSERSDYSRSIRIKFFLSQGTISPNSTIKLGVYLITKEDFVPERSVSTSETNLLRISSGALLRDIDQAEKDKIQELLNTASNSLSPVIISKKKAENLHSLYVCYIRGTTHSFMSSITTLLGLHNIVCTSKFIDEFSNGFNTYKMNIRGSDSDIAQLVSDIHSLYVIPRTNLSPLLYDGKLNVHQILYAYTGQKFVYHFLNKQSEEFVQLWESLKDDPIHRDRLLRLKRNISTEAATELRISQTILDNVDLIKELYEDFEHHFKPRNDGSLPPKPKFNSELEAKIKRTMPNLMDTQIFCTFLTLNSSILKTNFFKKSKSALAIQLDPSFLSLDFLTVPYSVILFVAAEFRGFHVRFQPVARGGIRMIVSRSNLIFLKNAENVFLENYNLAWTQQKKNKDIPEGGSKGTILLSPNHSNKATVAFHKYIDSMLDLLLVTSTDKDPEIVDHKGGDDYIFCGPDEGTADLMDWAAEWARHRKYKYWSAFTTGKSTKLGGIPHDTYGMTTRGVHQYVIGLMGKLGIKEEDVIKTQTGGPDGDLGSNEILISKDKTKAIIDGSGVICDPHGLDRGEITKLAKARKMIENFDSSKLSKDGFIVLLSDKGVKLPDGTIVDNGMNFRNNFHLTHYASCDFFVPCGGRPESITIHNVNKLFIDGKPIFKNVVEGANLFFTQEARLVLERAGVPVFKDASANKGGVTSSSLEVLAALCLTEEEHATNMRVKENGEIPQFYKEYVIEVQNKIELNAKLEFGCIWNEHQVNKQPMCNITDTLSDKINTLNMTISQSSLFQDHTLKFKVLKEALPLTLQKLLGLEEIVKRLPDTYISAVLAAHLASRYVYEFGLAPGEFTFYQYMSRYH